MKRLLRPSRLQLALILKRKPQHQLQPDQAAVLLLTFTDLLKALGMSPPGDPNTP
jgi:hypothetical protein